VAARKPDRAVRAREQDPRDPRAQGTGAAEIVAPRKVLDAKAARLAAGDLLSRRAWTRAELTARLRRRGAPPEIAAEIVADLVARGYIDDVSYARHWVTTRAPRGYGVARLRAELRGRGVATAIIDAALGDVGQRHDGGLHARLGEGAIAADLLVARPGVLARALAALGDDLRPRQVRHGHLGGIAVDVDTMPAQHVDLVPHRRRVAEQVARVGVAGDQTQCLVLAAAADQDARARPTQ